MCVSSFLTVVGVLAGVFGGFLLTFGIVLQIDQSPGCDISCGRWSAEITYAGALIGGLVGGVAGWVVGRRSERRS